MSSVYIILLGQFLILLCIQQQGILHSRSSLHLIYSHLKASLDESYYSN